MSPPTAGVTIVVIAKAPVAGRVKTRLCPPCTPAQAADIAEAALCDTLSAVAAAPAVRRVVALDGAAGAWMPAGFDVEAQGGGGLDERLARVFSTVGTPTLLIGMDTPQVTPDHLHDAARALMRWPDGAVLGLAVDGGWWAVGLRRADPATFLGIPMSTADTGRRQRARLRALGSIPYALPELRDVDTFDDARQVAALVPGSRFAAEVRLVERALDVDHSMHEASASNEAAA